MLTPGAWAATGVAATSPLDTLDAGHAVQLALARGADAIAADAARMEARAALQSARAALLPHATATLEAGLTGYHARVTQGTQPPTDADEDGRNSAGSTTLSWSLFDAQALSAYAAARVASDAASFERTDTRLAIEFAASRQFWNAVRAERIAGVSTEALALARDEELRTEVRQRVGAVPEADLFKARLRTSQAVLDSLASRREADVQRLALLELAGLPADDPCVLDTTLRLPAPTAPLDVLLLEAHARRPDAAAAQARVRSAQWALRSVRHDRWPTLGLSGSARCGDDRVEATPGGTTRTHTDRNWRATLALTNTMLDGGSHRARITNAEAALQRRSGERDATMRRIETDVREAALACTEARQSVEVASYQVTSATENLRSIRRRYELGSVTMLELVDAQVQSARAHQATIEAQVALLVADAQLARALGRSVVSR